MDQKILGEHSGRWMLKDLEAKYTWSSTWCRGISHLRKENTQTIAQ